MPAVSGPVAHDIGPWLGQELFAEQQESVPRFSAEPQPRWAAPAVKPDETELPRRKALRHLRLNRARGQMDLCTFALTPI